ncbi:MAG: hypothetical protein JWQ27_1178 [Ferruginibacter sp.]|nr:hypothetical protein [Ferruginibacter sp.]
MMTWIFFLNKVWHKNEGNLVVSGVIIMQDCMSFSGGYLL